VQSHSAYRRAQPFTFLWVVLVLAVVATAVAAGLSGDPRKGLVLAIVGTADAAVALLLGRLVIELRGQTLHWHFGFLGWPRWQVALHDIARVELTRVAAWRGAGIKGPRQRRLYNASLGGSALKLTMRDGREVTLGSPEPERLRAFIEARRAPVP
jgi:hypothetical protein